MVKDFYLLQGFEKVNEDAEGNITFKLDISEGYVNKNNYINVVNE